MTATTSANGGKARAKFSSRNLSALFKAPALRNGDAASGYGSPSGLNRMLVLRGPVRGGALIASKASAAAAPTPINSPSLRKENLGQDVTVSLVPAGKGGWGSGDADGDADDADDGDAHGKQPTAPSYQSAQARDAAGVWQSGSQRVTQDVRHSTFSTGGGSGRWGDDAVEEDLMQSEWQREQERKQAYPDLSEQQMYDQQQHHQRHSRDRPMMMRHGPYNEEQQRQFQDGGKYPQDARGHPDSQYQHRGAEFRTSSHHRNQDARFDSPSRYAGHTNYPPAGNRDQYDHGGHRYHDLRQRDEQRGFHHPHNGFGSRAFEEARGYADRGDHLYAHPQLASPQTKNHDNQAEHLMPHSDGGQRGHDDSSSSWKNSPPNMSSQAGSSATNVWKMSEGEVTVKHLGDGQAPFPAAYSYAQQGVRPSSATSQPPSSNPVRILKRTGPRMLFDPKSGTMVNAEEAASTRRTRTPSPVRKLDAREDEILQQNVNAAEKVVLPEVTSNNEVDPAVIVKEQSSMAPPSEAKDSGETATDAAKVKNSADGTHEEESPQARRRDRSVRPRSQPNESRSTRVAMGGKMKKVVVAYRPVVKPPTTVAAHETSDAIVPPSESTIDKDKVQTRKFKSKKEKDIVPKSTKARAPSSSSSIKEAVSTTSGSSTRTDRGEMKRGAINACKVIKPRSVKSDTMIASSGRETRTSQDIANDVPTKQTQLRREKQSSGRQQTRKTSDQEVRRVKRTPAARVHVEKVEIFDHGQNEGDDNDDETFTTVKSRRTVLLERKKQRELEHAAALNGFHDRGGVKRPTNRAVLPSAMARFGKKGVLVGFKQKETKELKPSETTVVATKSSTSVSKISPPTPSPLARSFIDVIRPPAPTAAAANLTVKQEDVADVQHASETPSPKVETKRPRKDRIASTPSKVDSLVLQKSSRQTNASATKTSRRSIVVHESAVEAVLVDESKEHTSNSPITAKKSDTLRKPRKVSISDNKVDLKPPRDNKPEADEQVKMPRTKREKLDHQRPAVSTKGRKSVESSNVKKVYVPKQVQATAEVCATVSTAKANPSNAISSPSTSPVVAAAPKTRTQVPQKPKFEPTAESKLQEPVTKPAEPRERRVKPVAKPTEAAPRVAADVKPQKEHRRRKTSASHEENVSTNSEETKQKETQSMVPSRKPQTESPLPVATIEAPPLTRRVSKPKPLSSSKASSYSTQPKIYKKVYVVKNIASTTAATSPSAA